jgi:hypothetical protein
MSINTTIGQVAATNPVVAGAVADQNTKSALLYSLRSGDSATGGVLGGLYQQKNEAATLPDSISPAYLGQNIDVKA